MRHVVVAVAVRALGCAVAVLALGCAKSVAESEAGGAGGTGGGTSTVGGAGGELVCDAGEPCENACVDLMSDPQNCGACGRTCVIASAEASCVAGECALGACDTGFADCDGDVNNGCEAAVTCEAGGACPTSCGSTGGLDCSDVCAPTCAIPAESCNLLDDDCDTLCDNGAVAGCRVGVHRAHGANGHYYGTSETEAVAAGYNIEALNYFYLYTAPMGELRPLFRCPKGNGKTFLSTDTACEIGAAPEVTVGFISPTAECGSVPLYRTQNTAAGAHFYTVSAGERDNAVQNLGFADEGIAGYIWTAP